MLSKGQQIVVRWAAPAILLLAAYGAGLATEAVLGWLLSGKRVGMWLIDHDAVQRTVALMEFALSAVAATVLVGYLSGVIIVVAEPAPHRLSVHLRHACLLYGLVGGVVAGYGWCAGNCEGLMLGALNIIGLCALGGIAANAWQLFRRRSVGQGAT